MVTRYRHSTDADASSRGRNCERLRRDHVIIPLWRTDKFAVGDWVVWSEIDAIDHLELRERFGAGGFRVVKVHNEPYSPNEDALSVGYPRHAAMGHTQYVWVDQGGDEPAQYSGAFFIRTE